MFPWDCSISDGFLRILPPLFAYLITLFLLTQVGFAETPTLGFVLHALYSFETFSDRVSKPLTAGPYRLRSTFISRALHHIRRVEEQLPRLAFCLVVIALTPIWSTIVLRSLAHGESLNSWRTDLRLTGIAMGSSLACFRFTPWGVGYLAAKSSQILGLFSVRSSYRFSVVFRYPNQPGLRALVPMITALCVGGVINAGLEGPRVVGFEFLNGVPSRRSEKCLIPCTSGSSYLHIEQMTHQVLFSALLFSSFAHYSSLVSLT